MKPPPRPLFLERQNYRTRRMMDMSRLLPVLGLLLFVLPLLRQSGGQGQLMPQMLFIFLSWLGLVICAALLSRRLSRAAQEPGDTGEPR